MLYKWWKYVVGDADSISVVTAADDVYHVDDDTASAAAADDADDDDDGDGSGGDDDETDDSRMTKVTKHHIMISRRNPCDIIFIWIRWYQPLLINSWHMHKYRSEKCFGMTLSCRTFFHCQREFVMTLVSVWEQKTTIEVRDGWVIIPHL